MVRINHTLRNELYIDIEFNCIDIIFGKVPNCITAINLFLCLIKRYIYTQKMNKCIPTFMGAKAYIEYYIRIDKYIHMKNMKYDTFSKKWGKFTHLLHE